MENLVFLKPDITEIIKNIFEITEKIQDNFQQIAVITGLILWAIILIIAIPLFVAFIILAVYIIKLLIKNFKQIKADSKTKFAENSYQGKNVIPIRLIAIIIALGVLASCLMVGVMAIITFEPPAPSEEELFDDYMSGFDYGDGYYYDGNDNTVKKDLWNILF